MLDNRDTNAIMRNMETVIGFGVIALIVIVVVLGLLTLDDHWQANWASRCAEPTYDIHDECVARGYVYE